MSTEPIKYHVQLYLPCARVLVLPDRAFQDAEDEIAARNLPPGPASQVAVQIQMFLTLTLPLPLPQP